LTLVTNFSAQQGFNTSAKPLTCFSQTYNAQLRLGKG
jgi:hypothetical protein